MTLRTLTLCLGLLIAPGCGGVQQQTEPKPQAISPITTTGRASPVATTQPDPVAEYLAELDERAARLHSLRDLYIRQRELASRLPTEKELDALKSQGRDVSVLTGKMARLRELVSDFDAHVFIMDGQLESIERERARLLARAQ